MWRSPTSPSLRTRPRRRLLAAVVVVSVAVVAAGCSSDNGDAKATGGDSSSTVRAVPQDYPTIQKAVNAAKRGDLVLVSPGTYKEEVSVETEDLVIRGTDRNTVIVDGEFKRDNGIKILADGVAVENLTVRNNNANGVFWTGSYEDKYVLKGYRASYVTAYNNGRYGIYAFNAANGLIEKSYGSGHPDSFIYIGQCNPCNAVVRGVLAEKNMLGYSGTNSSNNLIITESVWRGNRAGIVPNSESGEKLAPQSGATIVANLVTDNNATDAPQTDTWKIAWGMGIVIGGGNKDLVERNVVTNQKNIGIIITDQPENFAPNDNQILDNKTSNNSVDLGYGLLANPQVAAGNCFAGNTFTTSFPEQIEQQLPCQGGTPGSGWDIGAVVSKLTPAPPNVDWKTVPAPPPQPNMPKATTATAVAAKASQLPPKVDLDKVTTPTG